MTVMAETSFRVKYKGEALADGRMPVRELAPALLALGELFREASTTLYPDRPPVVLDIHATREGSFDVGLILRAAEDGWDAAEQLFGGDALTTLLNLRDVVLGSGSAGLYAGVMKLIAWRRGIQIDSEEEIALPVEADSEEPSQITGVRLGIDGIGTLDVSKDALELTKKISVRRSAYEVVKPLHAPGVDEFESIVQEEVTLSLGDDDLPAFEAIERPEDQEELEETERAATVQIAGINWGGKWRLLEGSEDAGFFATIEDPAFKEKIAKGVEVFREGDLLKCTLRTQQRKVGTQLRAEHRIVKVEKHIAATEQLNIDSLPESADSDDAAEAGGPALV